ncbi:MAG: hypothetical protein HYX78_04760 [Armatimonadetes bacterium]|nr:hypothetical protein [Armatimonadota bacterium]
MAYLDSLTRHALRASIQPDGKIRLEPDWLITDGIRQIVHEHREELVREITENAASGDPSEETVSDYHLLWVATDLDSFEEYDPRFGYELSCDPVYRMLDAPYYAWLRHRMENARKSHGAGRLDDSAFEVLRTRFNTIHSWAVRHIGEEALRRAIRTTNVKSYVPPSEQTFSAYRKTWDDAWSAYQRNQAACNRSAEPSDQARRLQHLLDTQGYAGIRSSIIDDVVVFVRDESVVVPHKWTTKVRFTLDELRLMVGSSPDAVKQIHEVKRVFGGKVVPSGDNPFAVKGSGGNVMPIPAAQQTLFQAGTTASAI